MYNDCKYHYRAILYTCKWMTLGVDVLMNNTHLVC